MSKNKLIQYAVLILVVVLIGGYFIWQNQIKQRQEQTNINSSPKTGIDRFFEFKVSDQNLTAEEKNKYYADFLNYEEAVKKDPKQTDALKEMAKIKKYIGDYEGARNILTYSEEISPLNYTIPASLGDLCQNFIKDYSCAEDAYKRAIDECVGKTATDCSLLYINLSDLYYNNFPDKKAEGEKNLLDGLDKLPDNLNLLSYLANYYKKEGNVAKAKEIYNKILKLDPANDAVKRELENLK